MDSIPIYDKNYHLSGPFYELAREMAGDVGGTVLDIGCGTQPHRAYFTSVDRYLGLDVSTDHKQVDLLGSGIDLPFSDASVDFVFSTQVLEHLADPFEFFSEVERVLKPGGAAFISTNQMYPIHEAPHDYFRFTRYGLDELASNSNLDTLKIFELGNLATRVVCELNYVFEGVLPYRIGRLFITLMNVIAMLLVKFNHRTDPIVTAIHCMKPKK